MPSPSNLAYARLMSLVFAFPKHIKVNSQSRHFVRVFHPDSLPVRRLEFSL